MSLQQYTDMIHVCTRARVSVWRGGGGGGGGRGCLASVSGLMYMFVLILSFREKIFLASKDKKYSLEVLFGCCCFYGRVIPVIKQLVHKRLPCLSLGVIGSVLGLVGPVSHTGDWMRRQL